MSNIFMQNCDPCYRCGHFAHYIIGWMNDLPFTICSNCIWYLTETEGRQFNLTPIPYATYNPWLYEDYYKDKPEKQQMFRNLMIINGFEEVEKYIWKIRKTEHGIQGNTHTQRGQAEG